MAKLSNIELFSVSACTSIIALAIGYIWAITTDTDYSMNKSLVSLLAVYPFGMYYIHMRYKDLNRLEELENTYLYINDK